MNIKIAAVQMRIGYLKTEKNIKKARDMLEITHREEADIICFPELFIAGPCLYTEHALKDYAQSIPGKFTETFSGFAEEYNLYIVMGSIVERENGRYYNTSVLLSPEGRILGKYRKIFLWHPEKPYIERGKELPVFKTQLGKIGIQICWDLACPEVTRALAKEGAEIVFCPSYWSKGDNPLAKEYGICTESRFIDSCVPARAMENELTFVFANGCGKWQAEEYEDTLLGHTQIALPFYGTIDKLAKSSQEGVLVRRIDFSVCRDARKVYRILEDLGKIYMLFP